MGWRPGAGGDPDALVAPGTGLGPYTITETPEYWENDTAPVSLPILNSAGAGGDPYGADPNPLFGHVVYASVGGADQPLAITRINYVWAIDWYYPSQTYSPQSKAPFTIMPFWNARGDAPQGVVTGGVLTIWGWVKKIC